MKERIVVRVFKASHYVDIAVKADNEGQAHSVAIDMARSEKVKMRKDKEGTLVAVTLEIEPTNINISSEKTH